MSDVWEALRETMPEDAIEWRVQKSGKSENGRTWLQLVPYANARWLMDRLDEILGPGGWQTRMRIVHTGHTVPKVNKQSGEITEVWIPPSIVCGLGIEDPTRGTLWKEDVGSFTDFGDPAKGGATHAFRRACVPWNIGNIRRLYEVERPCWADVCDDGRLEVWAQGHKVRYDPPILFGAGGLLDNGGAPQAARAPTGAPGAGTPNIHVLERVVERGKHKGKTWGAVVLDAPDYVEWALTGTKWFDAKDATALREVLDAGEDARPPVGAPDGPFEEDWRPVADEPSGY